MRRPLPLLAASGALFLAACQDGTIVLDIADAPVDQATSVVLQISEIDLLKSDGDDKKFTFSPPREVDLLDFTGGLSSNLLDGQRVPEGDYTGLRLILDTDDTTESHIDIASTHRRLVLASGGDELTIDEPFTIERRKELAITLDLDLRQSVLATNDANVYELDPIARLIKTEDAAKITGTVPSTLVSASSCTPVVYAFAGHDADPDDMGSATDVVASAAVNQGSISGNLVYTIAFLPAGDYTVALTCDALADDPRAEDNDVAFPAKITDVTVEAGETATANF